MIFPPSGVVWDFASICSDPALASNLAIIEVRHAKKFGSAWHAKFRLREVIAADRAAVPCGRWVKQRKGLAYEAWAMQNALAPGFKPCPPPKFDKRPRYRWSERR